jgi:hypothetical protein
LVDLDAISRSDQDLDDRDVREIADVGQDDGDDLAALGGPRVDFGTCGDAGAGEAARDARERRRLVRPGLRKRRSGFAG